MAAVKSYFEAVNQGDFAAAMAAYTDDVVLVVAERVAPQAGVFAGRDAVGAWFGDWFRSFARGYQFHIEELLAAGERVFMVARHHSRGRASGVALDWSVAYSFVIREGKIARLELFADRPEALKATGLEE